MISPKFNEKNNKEHEKENNDEIQKLMDNNKNEEGNNQDDVDIAIGKTKQR